MKYYSQYRSHDLFELQESLLGLSKSNRRVKLADHLPWNRIEKENVRRCADRIISIYRSHLRPIVRGKAKATVEFGARHIWNNQESLPSQRYPSET